MMMFDEKTGKRIVSVHKTHQIHDDVVVDLGSRFDGLSDNAVNVVRDMVKKDKIEKLDKLLITLNGLLN
ncbi:hypothetical protein [Nitrosopumilus sp.]|uniref:hypothetical protein n=1 Tax=Nitrosopumilus sp. TaxID=2024843 RepID=UPI00247B722C|nr:hypothetical protein [Nitrosopumilus sp.]MCV0409372.1 hypothetical protein [Nitrosopumilus sp.]